MSESSGGGNANTSTDLFFNFGLNLRYFSSILSNPSSRSQTHS